MELRDWIYGVGIVLTFVASSASLYFTFINRVNVLREHLYKEQFEKYKETIDIVVKISTRYNWIMNRKATQKEVDEIYELLSIQHQTIQTGAMLFTGDLYDAALSVYNESQDLYKKIENENIIYEKDAEKFWENTGELFEALRKMLGVEKLTYENLKLVKHRIEP